MIASINSNKGLVRNVVIVIVILLILAYFGLNLRAIVGSQTFQDNWAFVKGLIVDLWTKILRVPVIYIWDHIIAPFLSKEIQSSTSSGSSAFSLTPMPTATVAH